MFSKILKSLSDTELNVISQELKDPNISNEAIISQLISKSNETFPRSDVFNDDNSIKSEVLLSLCFQIISELFVRLDEKLTEATV